VSQQLISLVLCLLTLDVRIGNSCDPVHCFAQLFDTLLEDVSLVCLDILNKT